MSPLLISLRRALLLASLVTAVGCSKDAGHDAPVTEAPSPTAAATPERSAPATSSDGVVLTISGPAFAEPQTFRIPGDSELLARSFDARMLWIQLSSKAKVQSSNGKHVLDGLIVSTKPGRPGEATDEAGLSELWLGFIVDDGSPHGQTASMSFKPSKGDRQKFRVVTEAFEEGARSSGHFTGKLQRTNIQHRHEIYEVQGTFNLRSD